jgi:hypothetical protein
LILIDGPTLQAVQDRNSIYNATEFIVSHRRIFKYRTRKMVRTVFEHRFHLSDKQRQALDKWPIGSEMEGEDVTTEEDFDSRYSFDSDDSF